MCEYARFNPDEEKGLPICTVDNKLCTLCVLGKANTYKKAKEKEKGARKNEKNSGL